MRVKFIDARWRVPPSSCWIGLLFLLSGCARGAGAAELSGGDGGQSGDANPPGSNQGGDGSTVPASDAAPPADAAVTPPGVLPDPVRVMPLGDSLTSGYAAPNGGMTLDGGYRIRLRERLLKADYAINFVGRQVNGPQGFDGEHESTPGASIVQVSSLWAAAKAAGHEPHVVLLMAGTNEQLGITADQQPEPAARALEQLIQQILSDRPEAQVVVALPPPLGKGVMVGPDRPARLRAYSQLVREYVLGARSAGMRVHLADLSGLDPDLLGDGVHPSTMAGYNAMADLWYPSVVGAIEALRR